MKKIILAFIFIALGTMANAQEKIGAHAIFGSYKGLGLGVNGEYMFNEKWAIAPDFTYFFPEGVNDESRTFWDVNINGHYYFNDKDAFKVYGLVGINYSHFAYETKPKTINTINIWNIDTKTNKSSFGTTTINIGIGGNYDMNDVLELFSNLKYTAHILSGVTFSVGVKYKF